MGFFDKLAGLFSDKTPQEKTVLQTEPTAAPVTNDDPFTCTIADVEGHFAWLLTEEHFPGYTVKADVHAQTFDPSAHPRCFPISYVFYREDHPVLAVLVMKKNQLTAMIAKGTYKVLEDNGIAYIRFIKEWRNEESYVLERVKAHLPRE